MKRLPFISTSVMLLLSSQVLFAQTAKQVVNNSSSSMRGMYIMQKQTIDSGAGIQPMDNEQWKVFTDKYVMFARRVSPSDSSAMFGIGTYRMEAGKIFENMFYGDAGPVKQEFQLAVERQNDGYIQVIDFPGSDKHYLLTEIYQRSNRNITSPLDGAWHLDKRVYIDKDGKSQTMQSADSAKQFKIYDSGNFMWASSYFNNPSKKWASSFGYGTFTVDGKNQITETNVQSTYASFLVGKPVKITFTVTGKDSYEQVIEETDGAKGIEYYSRLK